MKTMINKTLKKHITHVGCDCEEDKELDSHGNQQFNEWFEKLVDENKKIKGKQKQ